MIEYWRRRITAVNVMKNEQVTLTTKKRGGTPVQQRYRKKGCQAVYVARTKKVFLHVKTKRRARALMNK